MLRRFASFCNTGTIKAEGSQSKKSRLRVM